MTMECTRKGVSGAEDDSLVASCNFILFSVICDRDVKVSSGLCRIIAIAICNFINHTSSTLGEVSAGTGPQPKDTPIISS